MSVKLSPHGLDAVEKVVKEEVLEFLNTFPEKILKSFLRKNLEAVTNFFKEKFRDDLGKNFVASKA